jgi:hypothetical protein
VAKRKSKSKSKSKSKRAKAGLHAPDASTVTRRLLALRQEQVNP